MLLDFKLKQNNTTVKTEILAGVTTFLAMAYILAVNPEILSNAGMPKGGVLIATALASFVGTMLMALLANYPFAPMPTPTARFSVSGMALKMASRTLVSDMARNISPSTNTASIANCQE